MPSRTPPPPTSALAGLALLGSVATTACVAAGPVAPKVVGGNPAVLGEYPFQAALLKTSEYGQGTYDPVGDPFGAFACGATLLGGPWVLTAAHCVSYRPYDGFEDPDHFPPPGCAPDPGGRLCRYRPGALAVLAGSEKLEPGKGRLHRVRRVIVHPGYETTEQEHDIALVELADAVGSTGGMLVADAAFTADALRAGSLARAVGWGTFDLEDEGTSPSLRQIDYPLQPLDRCRERHRLWSAWKKEEPWRDFDPAAKVTPNMVCAGWDGPPPAPGGGPFAADVLPNVCWGDSGGFVGLKDARGRWVQVGTPSWQYDCATPYAFSVQTNIAAYRSWIKANTGLTLPAPAPKVPLSQRTRANYAARLAK